MNHVICWSKTHKNIVLFANVQNRIKLFQYKLKKSSKILTYFTVNSRITWFTYTHIMTIFVGTITIYTR